MQRLKETELQLADKRNAMSSKPKKQKGIYQQLGTIHADSPICQTQKGRVTTGKIRVEKEAMEAHFGGTSEALPTAYASCQEK
eukprot:1096148-Amphidinium_carterae.1